MMTSEELAFPAGVGLYRVLRGPSEEIDRHGQIRMAGAFSQQTSAAFRISDRGVRIMPRGSIFTPGVTERLDDEALLTPVNASLLAEIGQVAAFAGPRIYTNPSELNIFLNESVLRGVHKRLLGLYFKGARSLAGSQGYENELASLMLDTSVVLDPYEHNFYTPSDYKRLTGSDCTVSPAEYAKELLNVALEPDQKLEPAGQPSILMNSLRKRVVDNLAKLERPLESVPASDQSKEALPFDNLLTNLVDKLVGINVNNIEAEEIIREELIEDLVIIKMRHNIVTLVDTTVNRLSRFDRQADFAELTARAYFKAVYLFTGSPTLKELIKNNVIHFTENEKVVSALTALRQLASLYSSNHVATERRRGNIVENKWASNQGDTEYHIKALAILAKRINSGRTDTHRQYLADITDIFRSVLESTVGF